MNTKYTLFVLFLIMAQVLAACGSQTAPAAIPSEPASVATAAPAPAATPEPVDPAAIAEGFYQAYNAGDIEAAMALVAEDMKCRGGCYLTGKDRFRFYIQGDINQGQQVDISDLKVEGDKVTYTVEVYSKGGAFLVRGIETLQIQDGLIILLEGSPFESAPQ